MHSICLSVSARFNSRKYSLDVSKFIHVIQISYSMNRIENYIHRTNILYTGSHKSFPIHYGLLAEIFINSITTYLCSIKYNEINICHSDIQNMFPVKMV